MEKGPFSKDKTLHPLSFSFLQSKRSEAIGQSAHNPTSSWPSGQQRRGQGLALCKGSMRTSRARARGRPVCLSAQQTLEGQGTAGFFYTYAKPLGSLALLLGFPRSVPAGSPLKRKGTEPTMHSARGSGGGGHLWQALAGPEKAGGEPPTVPLATADPADPDLLLSTGPLCCLSPLGHLMFHLTEPVPPSLRHPDRPSG